MAAEKVTEYVTHRSLCAIPKELLEKNSPKLDPTKNILDETFANHFTKEKIVEVTFLDTLKDKPADSKDISKQKNGSVWGWIKDGTHLYIAGKGGVWASNCEKMFKEFSSLKTIHFDKNFHTENVTSMRYMFWGCNNLTHLDLSHFDTSNVTDMRSMFSLCRSLTQINLKNFDTSNVTDMCGMFFNCIRLTQLDLSHFDTSNVTNMCDMFSICRNLTQLDISHFDTSNVTDIHHMFFNCGSLTQLDLSHFDTSNVTNMRNMFSNCTNLTNLNTLSFNTEKVIDQQDMFEGVPKKAIKKKKISFINNFFEQIR